MDRQTVFTKTAKGMMEATGKTSALSRDMRALLKEVDGKATVGDVHVKLGKVPEDKLHSALQALAKNDFIREFRQSQGAAPPQKPAEVDIDLDFTTAIPTLSTLTKKAEDEARQKAQAEADAARRAQAEASAKAKAEAEARANAAAAAARAHAEAEARARAETERRTREAAERERKEAEERARRQAEEQARREAEAFALAQEAARIEAERKAQEAAERERQEAEARARAEAERREREEAERREREKAERKAQERAQREAEAQAHREEEQRAREREAARIEAERKAQEAAERERQEAEARARAEAERREREETERREREEAERKARDRAQREAEKQARLEAEEYARVQESAREVAERKARDAAEHERQEAEERARREAAEQARGEEEGRAREREAARIEAERKAQEAAARERQEAEARARARVEAERRDREEAERKAQEAAERERQEAEARAHAEAEDAARRAREEAERTARETAQRESEDAVAHEAAPPLAAASGHSLDDAVKIETDFDAVLRASGGAPWDEPKRSPGADDKLQKEAEEQANREAEERVREQADAAAERAEDERRRGEEERAQERAPDEAVDTEHLWDRAEAHALAQAQEAETERHFAEMEKELEAEQLAAPAEVHPSESRELARKREQDEARERERAEAEARELEAEAAHAAEMALDEAPVRLRTPANWGRPVALALFVMLFLGLISVPFIPFDGYIPQFEKLAGDYLQQPVKIKTLNLMLLPQPHWRMDDVSVGDQGQLSVARVNAIAELGSMFSDKKVFKSIELESPVLSEQGLLALLFGKPHGQDFKVAKIVVTNGKLNSKNFNLPALDATIAVGRKEGIWQTITLETPDHNTRLQLTPDGMGAHIEVHTNAFSMLLNPSFILENFDATGVIRRGELRLSEFSGGSYGGIISGNATLTWGADWSLRGEIRARAIDPGKLAQKLIEGGRVEGKATYALQAKSYADLFAAPHLEGGFAVGKGALLGVELGRFLQGGGAGGKSEFAELTGTFVYDAGKTQLRQIRLVSGPLSASGSADTDRGGHISGRFVVDLKSSVAQARANLALSGALGDPHFSR